MTKVCLQNMGQIVDIYLLGELDGVVQNQIHEGIKAAEGAFNLKKRFVNKSFLTWTLVF